MSDQQEPKVPGQAVGTAPAQVSAEGQSPTTAVTPEQEPASQTGQEAKPVTARDLATLEDKLRREIQSKTDKSEGRIRQAVEDVKASIARLDSLGHKVSPEEAQSMMSKAYDKAKLETATEPIDEQTVDPLDASKWDPQNPLTTVAKRMMANKQLTLDAGDPEAKMIDYSDGAAWLISLESALNAKSVRLKSPPKQEEPKSNTNAAARIPASGGSSGGEPAKSGRELLGRAHKED